MNDIEKLMQKLVDIGTEYGLKLIGAVIVLVIGLWAVKLITNIIKKRMENSQLDVSVRPFLISLINTLLKVLLGIAVLSTMGIEMTSFVAILGAAGLAVGMALSGTLQNFAGGVMILIFKPFRVGHFIEAQGYSGTVKEIQIFVTILNTADNKVIIIPNGPLSNGSLINYSREEKRRVDWTIGVSYDDDMEKVQAVIREVVQSDDRVLKDPEVFIGLNQFADSSVNFAVRAWVKKEDYWGVYFDTNKKLFAAFNEQGISIPYPQMDIHMKEK
ncbi:mechanosensitive ion channel family protein [Algivirga pacifica]|uniref:Mechanosensitive ion channel n=1 Tax=Algivirga pacifica TaxID=1162670 RepID=A0ABP9D1C1_9BACT